MPCSKLVGRQVDVWVQRFCRPTFQSTLFFLLSDHFDAMDEHAASLAIELSTFPPTKVIDKGISEIQPALDLSLSSSSDESISEFDEGILTPLCRICKSKSLQLWRFCHSCGHPQLCRNYQHESDTLCSTCSRKATLRATFCYCCGFPLYLKEGEGESMNLILDESKIDTVFESVGYGCIDCIVG